jgi:hypothetical protein
MLFNGEHMGDGTGPEVDIPVDPVNGTTLAAKALNELTDRNSPTGAYAARHTAHRDAARLLAAPGATARVHERKVMTQQLRYSAGLHGRMPR